MTIKSRMLQSRYHKTFRGEMERSGSPCDDHSALAEMDASQVLDTCVRKDGSRYYKIRWRDSWEREDSLQGFDKLIREFWEHLENKRNRDQLDLQNGDSNALVYRDIADRDAKSTSPSQFTSGRRKGRPKKLISNHDQIPNRLNERNKYGAFYQSNENENEDDQKELFQSRNGTVKQRTSLVEEYPVMILHESNEENQFLQNVQMQCSNVFSDNASMITEEKKDTAIKTAPALIGVNKKHCPDKFKDDIKLTTSQIFMGQPLDIKPPPHLLSYVTVVKPVDASNVSERTPLIYQTQIKNNATPYFVNEKNSNYSSPVSRSTVIGHSENSLMETSQLLLKVTSSSFKNNNSNTIMSVSSSPATVQDSSSTVLEKYNKCPIKQENNAEQAKSTLIHTFDTKIKGKLLYQITADGEQRPQCSECFQTFKKRAALERHMMIHRGIKPFQCHFCNQRFRQKHHLQGHIMLHTGERPHSCTLCNKRFRMRHHLLEHERISHKLFR